MKRKISLILTGVLCAALCTACGGRTADDRRTDRSDTTIRTERAADTTERSKLRKDAEKAAEDAGEAVSEAVGHGRDMMTDIADEASEAVADRSGDGDYHADDNGRVRETTRR